MALPNVQTTSERSTNRPPLWDERRRFPEPVALPLTDPAGTQFTDSAPGHNSYFFRERGTLLHQLPRQRAVATRERASAALAAERAAGLPPRIVHPVSRCHIENDNTLEAIYCGANYAKPPSVPVKPPSRAGSACPFATDENNGDFVQGDLDGRIAVTKRRPAPRAMVETARLRAQLGCADVGALRHKGKRCFIDDNEQSSMSTLPTMALDSTYRSEIVDASAPSSKPSRASSRGRREGFPESR